MADTIRANVNDLSNVVPEIQEKQVTWIFDDFNFQCCKNGTSHTKVVSVKCVIFNLNTSTLKTSLGLRLL